jgi:hypothetical protein
MYDTLTWNSCATVLAGLPVDRRPHPTTQVPRIALDDDLSEVAADIKRLG